MRLLGDLHRGSQGGAEVEQVGEAAGEDLLGALPPGTRLLQAHLPAGKVSLNAPASAARDTWTAVGV